MSSWALGAAAVLYLIACIGELRSHHHSMALTLGCYALANVGLILASRDLH